MIREIKFRAWDDKEKKMLNHMDLFKLDTTNEEAFLPLLEKFKPRYKIMQHTGLRDRNGVEIYEGDILEGRAYQYQEDIKGEVYYTNRGTWDCDSFIIGGLNEDCEIIGNIYEHQHSR